MSQNGYVPNPYAQTAPVAPMQPQYPVNPYVETAEQRLARLSQLYGYPNPYGNGPMNPAPPVNQNPPQQNQQAQTYECRPVTSIDEVKAIQVDFSGRPQFFLNQGAGEVYVKQLNEMGSSDYYAAKLQKVNFASGQPVLPTEEPKQEQPAQQVDYATYEDLNALRNELAGMIGGMQHECKCKGQTANVPAAGTADATPDAPAGNAGRKSTAKDTAKPNVSTGAKDG